MPLSVQKLPMTGGGARLFLIGVTHGYYEKEKLTWRYPPKAAMPEHGAGVVEAKRNGGLDLLKTAVPVSDTGKRTKSSARQRFFSFPRCGGRCLD